MSQGEALGTKMRRNGGVGRPVSSGITPARKNGMELGNAALPALVSGNGGDAGVEEALAELWTGWVGGRRGGELRRSC